MGCIYVRRKKLWIRFKGPDGKWTQSTTPFRPGEEKEARKLLKGVERKIAAGAELGLVGNERMTVARYKEMWCREREADGVASAGDDEGRLRNYWLPALGKVLLEDVRPRHVQQFVRTLKRRCHAGEIAPRTVRNIYFAGHAMFENAVADELIEVNPCKLKSGDLPKKVDKDPAWRRSAIYSRDEIEMILSDERVPEDRRVLYALEFFAGGARGGEAAAARWGMYDNKMKPLGRLILARSYNTKLRVEKGVKTEVPREIPVHPTLARILAEWKLGGWTRMMGRPPRSDDLIIPSRRGQNRNVNHALRKFHQDLERLGLRKRRLHDLRRSLVSLAREDDCNMGIFKFITHGSSSSIIDQYTTLSWEALCREMLKLKVGLRADGEVVPLRQVGS